MPAKLLYTLTPGSILATMLVLLNAVALNKGYEGNKEEFVGLALVFRVLTFPVELSAILRPECGVGFGPA